MSTVRLIPAETVAAELRPPLSKSDAHRALALRSILGEPLDAGLPASLPSDVRVVIEGLRAIAAPPDQPRTVNCLDAGAPFRFLLTQAAVAPSRQIDFVGTPRLGERPVTPLLESLRAAIPGLTLTQGSPWPLSVRAPDAPTVKRLEIDGTQSSQFVSSALLGAARVAFAHGSALDVLQTGAPASEGYTALTVHWLRRCGFEVTQDGQRYSVRFLERPRALPEIPGDWSSAGYLLALAWATGSTVVGVDPEALHPDRAVVRILRETGLEVRFSNDRATVRGTAIRGLIGSGKECPDLLPTLAAIACVIEAPSVLEDVSILKLKESDRRAGIVDLVRAAGGEVEDAPNDSLRILPPAKVRPFHYSPRKDHRLAMSAATLSVLGRVSATIEQSECVEKSFPAFFDELRKTGFGVVSEAAR